MPEAEPPAIRLATSADVEALTDLHCACFRPEEHVPLMLGRDYVRATYRWHVATPRVYTLVAETGDRIAGLIGVCNGAYTLPMFIACFAQLGVSLLKHPSLLFRRPLWLRLLRRPKESVAGRGITKRPGFAQVTNVAVDPRLRGEGVFSALIQAVAQHSRARGSRAVRVGIYKTNEASRRAFAKAGWVETPELETPDTVFCVAYLDPSFQKELGWAPEAT